MILNPISIDMLLKSNFDKSKIFIEIPFLYFPFLKELKKKESNIKKINIRINKDSVPKNEVILSFLRLFGIADEIKITDKSVLINYAKMEIGIGFNDSCPLFYGECTLDKSLIIFSEDLPFIKVKMDNGEESIIVLPEGDGVYYMNLDKKESEEAGRCSIIADPLKMIELVSWMAGTIGV